MAETFYPFVENGTGLPGDDIAKPSTPARIAVYDDMAMAPRVVMVQPSDIRSFLDEITKTVYELASQQCPDWSFMLIRELVENYIHASFLEPTISIYDKGQTITFSDQGPGIPNKAAALKPSFSSATAAMKHYIRGVGSGLPIVERQLRQQHGTLTIEDNLGRGTIVTVSLVQHTDEEDENEGESVARIPLQPPTYYPGTPYFQAFQQAGYFAPNGMAGGWPANPYGYPQQGYQQGYQQPFGGGYVQPGSDVYPVSMADPRTAGAQGGAYPYQSGYPSQPGYLPGAGMQQSLYGQQPGQALYGQPSSQYAQQAQQAQQTPQPQQQPGGYPTGMGGYAQTPQQNQYTGGTGALIPQPQQADRRGMGTAQTPQGAWGTYGNPSAPAGIERGGTASYREQGAGSPYSPSRTQAYQPSYDAQTSGAVQDPRHPFGYPQGAGMGAGAERDAQRAGQQGGQSVAARMTQQTEQQAWGYQSAAAGTPMGIAGNTAPTATPAGAPSMPAPAAGAPAQTSRAAVAAGGAREIGIDAHVPLAPDQRDVIMLFSITEKVGPKELSTQLGLASSSGSRKLRELAEAGFIVKRGQKYNLTGEGERVLSYLMSKGV